MAEIVKDYNLRIDTGTEGARGEFHEFLASQKVEMAEQVKSGNTIKEWFEEATRVRLVMEGKLIEERRAAMVAKLTELGHDPRDVNTCASDRRNPTNIFWIPRQLSDAEWERVRPKADAMVEMCKRHRLQRERSDVVQSRYANFRKTYDAYPDRLVPDKSSVLSLPIIAQIIESDGDDIEPRLFDEAFNDLPAAIDEWRRVRRADLARMILEAQGGSDGEDPDTAEEEGILHLATSIFVSCAGVKGFRANSPSVYWLETIHERRCVCSSNREGSRVRNDFQSKYDGLECLQALPDWIAQARELVQAAGLDPRTATAKDMDNCNPRFWCKDCLGTSWKGNVARSWRNCMAHLGHHNKPSSWKGFELLSAKDRAIIEAKETALAAIQEIDWNKVALSLQGLAVDVHKSVVKLKHPSLPSPAQGGDLDAAPDEDATEKKVKCKFCLNSSREFTVLGLANHIEGKHGITNA
ncbi:hypothetical protein FRC00_001302 [Tulasnella sp. 408]|nr:hypothetical protein FRC00_001302 [Tulasnella sp. 408]